MFKKDKTVRDAYTLSLGGTKVITSFAAAHAIAHDRLRQVQFDSDQKSSPMVTLPSLGRFWVSRARRSRAAV